jgi:hypothetical protein
MVTKEQAIQAASQWGRAEFHWGDCKRIVGTRGGVTIRVEKWRVNGACKTWKTRPDEFSLPIKYGMRGYSYITDRNAHEFHLADDCPLDRCPCDSGHPERCSDVGLA